MEIETGTALPPGRIRRPGAGRPKASVRDPELLRMIEDLVEPDERGDPQSPLRWTCKSTRSLARILTGKGHPVSHETIAHLLHGMGYSLQAVSKTKEGEQHPDRNEQFRYINEMVKRAMAGGSPVVSVDTKKKELLGDYHNKGRRWLPKKSPIEANTHDFPDPDVPRAFPYGIYDMAKNRGFVNVGTDHDTGAFAVASIKGWWRAEGRRLYPHAGSLLITADGGGSNGIRRRLWKLELQKMADECQLTITVCHFPPGTSRWNKIEHRLFSFISSNWRGQPLTDYETIVQLIAHTTTAKGLTVTCRLDRRRYADGIRVSDEEMSTVNIERDPFHGEWNYTIRPRRS
jgi:hypothetical protein